MGVLADLSNECAERGERPAVIAPGGVTTSVGLADRALRLATLLREHGIGTGDRVIFLGPTDPIWLAYVLACARVGAVPTTLNWRLSPRELAELIVHSRARGLLADPAMLAPVDAVLETLPAWTATFGPDTHFDEHVAACAPDPVATPGGPDAVAMQIYTSGTTARPKGVMLSNAALDVFLSEGTRAFRLGEGSRGLYMLPLFHIAGGGFALLNLVAGSVGVIPRAQTTECVMDAISSERITHLGMVPTLMQAIVDHPDRHAYDLSSIETVIYGAAPITPALLARTLESIGSVFVHTYGLTETAGFVTVLEPHEHDASIPGRLQSCGRAVPWADIRIADLDTGGPVPLTTRGEIQVKSPSVMTGYFDAPDLTADAFTSDGYLRTGDIGMINADGYIFVVDRLKDLIITGGENVSPGEVEAVLASHPDLAQVAVIGTPHERWGETVTAIVVARAGRTVDPDAVIAYTRGDLARYKCPTRVTVVETLPTNATGKIDRVALRRAFGAPQAK